MGQFPAHLVFFPTTFGLSVEWIGMVVAVGWISFAKAGVINLPTHPSLGFDD
jgi:hypothetical protein